MKNYIKGAIVSLISLAVLYFLCMIVVSGLVKPCIKDRIIFTANNLSSARWEIKKYKEKTGDFPRTLSEIRELCQAKNELQFIGPFEEIISSSEVNSNEYSELNGKGGFYYNSQTGEVRINLTLPLKDYFPKIFLSDKFEEEVPANW